MKFNMVIGLLDALQQLRRHEHWTKDVLEQHRSELLAQIRAYAYANSPFYYAFHHGRFDEPLSTLPVLTKQSLLEHYDALVTDRSVNLHMVRAHAAHADAKQKLLGRYRVNSTSGSTGQPALFLFNEEEWLHVLASFARAHEWAGVTISLTHRMKMASVASTAQWHMSSQVSASVKSWWMPTLRLAASEPLPSLIQQLNAWQPDVLVSYASMTRILAAEQLEGRLKIQPHFVYASSEVLTEETRRLAEHAWGKHPFNEYATTEVGAIAAEHAEDRRMHVFDDLLIVESVDSAGNPVPDGEYGAKVLVTSLFNRTLPLIRYEINDSICLQSHDPKSRMPFAWLAGIQGRAEDALSLPGIAGGRVTVLPLVIHRVMDTLAVHGWRVVQLADDRLTVLLAGAPPDLPDHQVTQAFTQALAHSGARATSIRVERVDHIPKSPSGKSPLIQAYRAPTQAPA